MSSEGWSILITGRQLEQLRAGRSVKVPLADGTLSIRQDAGAVELSFAPKDADRSSPAWPAPKSGGRR